MPPERSAGTRKPKLATIAMIPTIGLHLFGEPVPLGRDPVMFAAGDGPLRAFCGISVPWTH